ncbi:MAG: hypothetical protein WCN88_04490 [Candidatus Falkowbacteria bacterium]
MKKLFYISLPSLALFALPAKAICPVCVVAVGAGLGLSEYLGIDDSIAGVWIGGMMVSLIAWTINWLNKKNWKFGNKDLRDILITIAYYVMVIWPLLAKDMIGHPWNKLFGIDKLALGITVGSLGFLLATLWYSDIKKKNDGHAQFPFQKVAWPVGALIILSFVFYLLIR